MTVRKILIYPQEREALRKQSAEVPVVNRRVRRLIKDLKDTLKAHEEGIGLAAPQIGEHRRVLIVRLSEGQKSLSPPLALVNPRVLETANPRRDFDGCLSFPGLYGETVRPHYLRVAFLDEYGNPVERVFLDFDAVLVHHEIDHLDGVLFIDRIERPEDLYHIREDEFGRQVRVPLSTPLDFIRWGMPVPPEMQAQQEGRR